MIALHPSSSDEQLDPLTAVAAEERPPPPDRPWVMTNMIASADGATAVDGLSGDLGGPADFAVFSALRARADAILVGASTVREEQYRPPSTDDERRLSLRRQRHQEPRPLIVVVTGRLDLDPGLPLFADDTYRPLILTGEAAPAEARERLSAVADVVTVGDQWADLGTGLAELHRRGHRVVLAEGGPSLNGQLIADDLIDEWNLSVSPLLAAGSSARPAHGPLPVGPPREMSLARVWLADELLFCRWVRRRRPA
ncbi:MAG: dihydrofolate reductase family protein [Actinomycetota bacterium]